MSLRLYWQSHTLRFSQSVRTSRGSMNDHQVVYLRVLDPSMPNKFGLGEAAPLKGLSFETIQDVRDQVSLWEQAGEQPVSFWQDLVEGDKLERMSSLRFALETALLDFENGGQRLLHESPFTKGEQGLPINGLVWMSGLSEMEAEARKKAALGYSCLKFKVGSHDFQAELAMLTRIRADHPELEIRLDANGAFPVDQALSRLEQLAKLGKVHSIEQPIAAGQWDAMKSLCAASPLPIALDEELIPLTTPAQREDLLRHVRPQFLILKPTLLGGMEECRKWIALAKEHQISYWLTSALESNVGLSAIAQFGATLGLDMPQGFGTGQLYENNIESPLRIEGEQLWYGPGEWDYSLLNASLD